MNACCAWVQAPRVPLARAEGLHTYASNDPTLDYACLASVGRARDSGTSEDGNGGGGVDHAAATATLTGYVGLLASNPTGAGTTGVRIDVFRVDAATGPIGAAMGAPQFTSGSSGGAEIDDWQRACSPDPCALRAYAIPDLPLRTPLVVKTSDATGAGVWADVYEYGVVLADAVPCPTDGASLCVRHDLTAATAQDLASLAAPYTLDAGQGILVGEVHDCADIRVSGANVDTDKPHLGAMTYFDDDEFDPLPDPSRAGEDLGTSELGRFVAVGLAAGSPIRVSAIGELDCRDTLLGTEVVQAYGGPALTFVTLRGRAP